MHTGYKMKPPICSHFFLTGIFLYLFLALIISTGKIIRY